MREVRQDSDVSEDVVRFLTAFQQLMMDTSTDMVDVIVDHGQGHTYRQHRYHRKRQRRIADKAVCLDNSGDNW